MNNALIIAVVIICAVLMYGMMFASWSKMWRSSSNRANTGFIIVFVIVPHVVAYAMVNFEHVSAWIIPIPLIATYLLTGFAEDGIQYKWKKNYDDE